MLPQPLVAQGGGAAATAAPEDAMGFQHGDVSLDPGKLQRLKPMPIQEKSPPPPPPPPPLSGQAGLQRCKPSARMLATA